VAILNALIRLIQPALAQRLTPGALVGSVDLNTIAVPVAAYAAIALAAGAGTPYPAAAAKAAATGYCAVGDTPTPRRTHKALII
jgi:hypothetical protein